jgi:hypothetical protein
LRNTPREAAGSGGNSGTPGTGSLPWGKGPAGFGDNPAPVNRGIKIGGSPWFRRFPYDHLDIIIKNIVPDKILLIEFQGIGTGFLGPKDKALPLRVKTPGTIGYTPAGA